MADRERPLAGNDVLVTGAIRAAIVEALAAEGAMPVIHHGRNRAAAEAPLGRIGGSSMR